MKDIKAPELFITKYHTLTKLEKHFNKNLDLKPEDQKLWEELSNGEEDAFRRIIDRYGMNLFVSARKFVKSEEIARYITEKTFTALYRKQYGLTGSELLKLFLEESKKNICEQFKIMVKEWSLQKDNPGFSEWAAKRRLDKDEGKDEFSTMI